MNSFNFIEPGGRSPFHVGLRTAKTVIAVFCCAIIGYLRGAESAIFSMIAAIMCIQPTRDESLKNALNRAIGTVIGGALGAGCLYLARRTGILDTLPLYYLMISVVLIPLIQITLLIRKPSITSFSCVVFLSVTVTRMGDMNPLAYAADRTLETLIGIVLGLGVNWIIPKSKRTRALEAGEALQDAPPAEAGALEETAPADAPEREQK